MTVTRRRLQIGKVPDGLDQETRSFLEAVRNQLNALQGLGTAEEQRPTRQEFRDIKLQVETLRTRDKTVYEELALPGNAMQLNGGAAWTSSGLSVALLDTGTSTMEAVAKLPAHYFEGSEINVHMHWYKASTGTGNVRLRLQWAWYNTTDVIPTPTQTFLTLPVPTAAQTQVMTVNTLLDTGGAGKKRNSFVDLQLARLGSDPLDTFVGSIGVKEIDIMYKRLTELPQALGQRSIYFQ